MTRYCKSLFVPLQTSSSLLHCSAVSFGDAVGGGETWLKMKWRYRQRNRKGLRQRERGGMGAEVEKETQRLRGEMCWEAH